MKKKKKRTAKTTPMKRVLHALSTAYAADPAAMHALISNSVPCNAALAGHPTVQVRVNKLTPHESFSVSALGLINGVVEPLTGKRVAAAFSKEDGQNKLIGFVEYPDPRKKR